MKSDFEEKFFLFFLHKIKGLSNRIVYQFISGAIQEEKIEQLIQSKLKDKKFVDTIRAEFEKIDEDFLTEQPQSLYHVNVTVFWLDPSQKEQSVSLTTLRMGNP